MKKSLMIANKSEPILVCKEEKNIKWIMGEGN